MAMTLVFKVPVHVEVDEVARTVLSVKDDDERAEGPVEGAAVADEASWPAWEFGL